MKKVVVVGAGALGANLVQLLRNVGASICIIDFDRVEAKNTQSQFHSKPGVGKSKTDALKTLVNYLWGMKVEGIPHKLVANNVKELLGGADLVIDCLDNGEGRRIIQAYVREQNIPCLHGAVDANGTFGRVVWDESFRIDDEDKVGAPTCENGEHLPFLSIVSSYLAHASKEYLSKGRKLGFQVSPGGTILT